MLSNFAFHANIFNPHESVHYIKSSLLYMQISGAKSPRPVSPRRLMNWSRIGVVDMKRAIWTLLAVLATGFTYIVHSGLRLSDLRTAEVSPLSFVRPGENRKS